MAQFWTIQLGESGVSLSGRAVRKVSSSDSVLDTDLVSSNRAGRRIRHKP